MDFNRYAGVLLEQNRKQQIFIVKESDQKDQKLLAEAFRQLGCAVEELPDGSIRVDCRGLLK